MAFTAIGNRIHKDRTTIAKEVKLHCFIKPYGRAKEFHSMTGAYISSINLLHPSALY